MSAPHKVSMPSKGLRVIYADGDESRSALMSASVAPHCAHGPCLLFERMCADGVTKRFYACAVYRSRKACSFYQDADEKMNVKQQKRLTEQAEVDRAAWKPSALWKRLKEFKSLSPSLQTMCLTCGRLLVDASDRTEHDDASHHQLLTPVHAQQLRRPSTLLAPCVADDGEAQYFFDEPSLKFLSSIVAAGEYDSVLCIGAPRLFEKLRATNKDLSLLLMDIDKRYTQFFNPLTVCQYSMYNHHFPHPMGRKTYQRFMAKAATGRRCLVLVDPPFGGLVQPLCHSLDVIRQDFELAKSSSNSGAGVNFALVMPYFLDKHLQSGSGPDAGRFRMLDYAVTYANHKLYKAGCKRAGGSPIRVFTDAEELIVLPTEQGYWHCKTCSRYSSAQNKHCKLCGRCPTKHGSTYRHCPGCGTCVKPAYSHCQLCATCHLPGKTCRRKRNASPEATEPKKMKRKRK